MKKLLVLLVIVLLAAGCAKDTAPKLTDGDQVLFEVNGVKYTKNDLYASMTADDVSNSVLSTMKMKLAEKENIDMTEIDEAAEAYYEYIAAYGDYYVSYYGGKEAIENSYKSYMIVSEIESKYVNDNLDQFIEDYHPFKAQVVNFSEKETAEEFIEKVNSGSTFEMAALELGYDNECDVTLYTDRDSNLNAEVKSFCVNAKEPGLSNLITSSSSVKDGNGEATLTATYYVVNVVSVDVEEFKDEFIETMVNNSYVDEDVVLNTYFKNHEINIYDQDVYDSLSATYEALEIK